MKICQIHEINIRIRLYQYRGSLEFCPLARTLSTLLSEFLWHIFTLPWKHLPPPVLSSSHYHLWVLSQKGAVCSATSASNSCFDTASQSLCAVVPESQSVNLPVSAVHIGLDCFRDSSPRRCFVGFKTNFDNSEQKEQDCFVHYLRHYYEYILPS